MVNREQLGAQLNLVIDVIAGKSENLLPSQKRLLGATPDEEIDDYQLAKEVLVEVLLTFFAEPEAPIDPQKLAVALLRQIEEAGGALKREQVMLPDEFIAELEQDGVVKRAVKGLVWGRLARKAIESVEGK